MGLLEHPSAIAIIGMAGRFPGARHIEQFRQNLANGVESITFFSDEELLAQGVPLSRLKDPNYVKAAPLLDDYDWFDASFFEYSPRDAELMDPEHRIFLECAWEALENAGYAPHPHVHDNHSKTNRSSREVGVFAGAGALMSSYLVSETHFNHRLSAATGSREHIANDKDYLSTRVSYKLNLQGPSLTVQTACSTSLVAVHLACQSLLNGECDMALAGGVSIRVPQRIGYVWKEGEIFSPDGHCRPFDADSQGTIFGSGVGLVVLKPLEDAIRDRDSIDAVIRGSAINNDGGQKVSYWATLAEGQADAISQALAVAEVEPESIGYVETHGTATSLGDPVEIFALSKAFSSTQKQVCAIGSVKSNIGHSDAASGVAGLIKAVLSLKYQKFYPSLHFSTPNPRIKFEKTPFFVNTTLSEWPTTAFPRRAAVNSLGIGGTNAHLILEEAPVLPLPQSSGADAPAERPQHLLTLSAKTPEALQALLSRYREHIAAQPTQSFADLCYTANTGRVHFEHRFALRAASSEEALEALDHALYQPDLHNPLIKRGQVEYTERPRIAFLFTGQGSQYVQMGRDIYESEPIFRQALERCDELLRPHLDRSLLEVLYPERKSTIEHGFVESSIDDTAYTQPALFALEYALAELWKSWGIEPDIVMGHSVGEYVAACVAGVFSLEDGLKLVAARGRLMEELPQNGAMVAIFASEAEVEEVLTAQLVEQRARSVSIAAINGPQNVVISGERDAVYAIVQQVERQAIRTQELTVSHAFHSPLMEPMLADFAQVASQVRFAAPAQEGAKPPRLLSNVTGELASAESATPAYWVRHISAPVRFADSISTLHQLGYNVFIEIGPKPTLLGMARRCLPADYGTWLPTLRQSDASAPRPSGQAWAQLLDSLAELYVRGAKIDWFGFDQAYISQRQRLHLPTYPFQRKRYWLEPAQLPSKKHDGRTGTLAFSTASRPIIHPLLQERYHTPLKEIIFETQIDTPSLAYLADHQVLGQAILPAAAYLEMALAAGHAYFKTDPSRDALSVRELVILQPLPLFDANKNQNEHVEPTACPLGKKVTIILTPEENGATVQLYTQSDELGSSLAEAPDWTLHASGKIARAQKMVAPDEFNQNLLDNAQAHSVEAFYHAASKRRIDYGPAFQVIQELWQASERTEETEGIKEIKEVIGRVRLPSDLSLARYHLHPILLDGCFQLIQAVWPDDKQVYLPMACNSLTLLAPGTPKRELWCQSQIRSKGQTLLAADFQLFAPDGQPIAVIEGLQLKRPEGRHRASERALWPDWLYEVAWRPQAHFGLSADYLPTPHEISNKLLENNEFSPELDAYQEGLAELERISLSYVVQALQQLGFHFSVGRRFSTGELAVQLGIIKPYRRLLARLLEILAKEGILLMRGDVWEVRLHPPRRAMPPKAPKIGAVCAESALLFRCGEELYQVLRGTIDPLELLFPNGTLTLVAPIYQESAGPQAMNRLVLQAVLDVYQCLPQNRGLRILEIGAGTGGTTSYLLPHLDPARTDYLFTDISPLFTSKAAEKFVNYPFVYYQVLNIEQAPASQGVSGHYDLILAANVLHATQDLQVTFEHIQSLLAPEGILLLLEATERKRWVDLTFGLTEGWWRFKDVTLRPDHPLLTVEAWQSLLLTNGFKDVVFLTPSQESDQAVMIAQKAALPAMQPRTNWLILTDPDRDGSGVGRQLASLLEASGQQATLLLLGKTHQQVAEREFIVPATKSDFEAVCLQIEPDVVVHCWSLESQSLTSLEALTEATLEEASRLACGTALSLVQALVELPKPPALCLVTQGAVYTSQELAYNQANCVTLGGVVSAPLWGMGKTIALEHPELQTIQIDLDPHATSRESAQHLCNELLRTEGGRYEKPPQGREEQVAFRGTERLVARLSSASSASRSVVSDQPYRLEITERGTLENLILQPTTRRQPAAGEVEIRVHAIGLNFLDVFNALGLHPGTPPFGSECAGEIVAVGEGVTDFRLGDAVVAQAPDTFRQYATVKAALVAHKPENLSDEEAATIPVAFLTASYSLHYLALLTPGDRVLIHSAAGGVGMAAVQLAQQAGAEVFATASPGKWAALKEMGVQHIYNSRTLSFAEQVMADTNGQGVDIVLNSLTREGFIAKSLSLLNSTAAKKVRHSEGSVPASPRFLELSKRNVWQPAEVAKTYPHVSYHLVDLTQVTEENPALIQKMLRRILADFAADALKPLPHQMYPIGASGGHDSSRERPVDHVVTAFRTMQQAKHIGKLVFSLPTVGSLRFHDNKSYLITGGLGGLGLEVARFMVERGARHLVLLTRRSHLEADVKEKLSALEEAGAQIVLAQADVSKKEQLANVLAEIEEKCDVSAPLAGIIHSAGVLDDGVLRQQTWPRFQNVFAAKVQGAWHLHALTRKMPLDFFVLFSSAASLLGSPGQANHAAANAFMDALAPYRRTLGLPALSINWGAWEEVGAAVEQLSRIKMRGMGSMPPQQGLEALEALFSAHAQAQVGVVPIEWAHFGTERSFFADFRVKEKISTDVSPGFIEQLNATLASQRRELLNSHLRQQVAQVLGFKHEEANFAPSQGFFELGMDSLTSIELRNRLQRSLDLKLSTTLLFDYPTLGGLLSYLSQELLENQENQDPPLPVLGEGLGVRADLSPSKGSELEVLTDLSALSELSELSEIATSDMNLDENTALTSQLAELEKLLGEF